MSDQVVTPHGGTLVNLLVSPERAAALKRESAAWPSWDLTPRHVCDLELLMHGGFSPLTGFLGRAEYERVCGEMRLSSGALWPIPIMLDVTEAFAKSLRAGATVALRDAEGVMLAVLHVEDMWRPDLAAEAQAVFGTTDTAHPGVAHLLKRTHPVYVGGRIEAIQAPVHYDFRPLRRTPAEVRAEFAGAGWRRIVGFQTRNPMHRAHQEVTRRAMEALDATLLLHPVVGQTKPGDIDHFTRVRCYQAILPRYAAGSVRLALLPLAMRMAGPREALWHGLIRKNYGCTHFIVGRDHASPGKDPRGVHFYGRYDAQDLFRKHEGDMGIRLVSFERLLYVPDVQRYVPEAEIPAGAQALTISGTEFRERLMEGRDIPEWFSFPEVVRELRRQHPARAAQGFTVFLTGLSGAGKSTIANILAARLRERGGRHVTVLDGDVVRKHLSSELGFSKADRDTNIRRIGFVAAELTRTGGAVICSPIAPYDAVRKEVRAQIAAGGGFALVYVRAPLEVCEARDRKGLYAKARSGQLSGFTGVSDPYEAPTDADVVVDTSVLAAEACADAVWNWLVHERYLEEPRA